MSFLFSDCPGGNMTNVVILTANVATLGERHPYFVTRASQAAFVEPEVRQSPGVAAAAADAAVKRT